MGLGRGAIQRRASAGRLHRLYPDVYAVGHVVETRRGRWMAAVLACGPYAVLSHFDAALLWGIVRGGSGPVHVTVPARGRKGHEGIKLHRVRTLDPRDHGRLHAIPVTSLARTLLDLAEVLPPRRLARAIEEAERLQLFDLNEIRAVIERNPGRRGIPLLVAGCEATLEEARHSRSDFERELLDVCLEVDVPLPAMNVMIEGEMVDAHWPGTTLIIELQSWEWHRTRQAFERDSAKAIKLEAAGYRVVPVTSRGLKDLRRTLPALLDSCRTPPAPGPGALARALP
jgi:very-short-patch-repair endonuclease